MQKTLPLYLGPSVIGSVTLDGDETSLCAHAETYASLDGICRAYIKSARSTLLIGVLAPDGHAFSAHHIFSKSAMREAEILPDEITYAYALIKENPRTPADDTWTDADALPELSYDNKIIATLIKSTGARVDSLLHPTKIAVPLFTGRPFPRPDILCLITPCRIDGEIFGIIGISEKGEPVKI